MLTRLLGTAGLAALATGVPASFLRAARAQTGAREGWRDADVLRANTVYRPEGRPRFLIMSTGRNGDPINANAPGSFDDPRIVHAPTPETQATSIRLGDKAFMGAQAWSMLPQAVLDRTCFFHGATNNLAHLEAPKVLSLMGASKDGEMLPSIYAASLAPSLETVLPSPLSLIGATLFEEEYVTFEGRQLVNHDSRTIRDMLIEPAGPLTTLRHFRDRAVDALHARLAKDGTAEQKAFVDRVAQSSHEARDLGEKLLQTLSKISGNSADDQLLAAAALIKMRVTPVVIVQIPFGGDNHKDPDLKDETTQLVSGVRRISTLMTTLADLGIQDDTSFMTLNPFGRTLKQLGTKGRNHLDHHVSVLIGKGIRAGVIGGVSEIANSDFYALGLDSRTGRGVSAGADVSSVDTLASLAKTVGAHLGVAEATLNGAIPTGKIVPAALVS